MNQRSSSRIFPLGYVAPSFRAAIQKDARLKAGATFACAWLLLFVLVVATPGECQKKPPAKPLDLNAASIAQLEQVPGIGPATAKAIVQFQREKRPFSPHGRSAGHPRHQPAQTRSVTPLRHRHFVNNCKSPTLDLNSRGKCGCSTRRLRRATAADGLSLSSARRGWAPGRRR